MHLLEIYTFKVLATNSNVRYNTGQQIVGQTEYLLKLGVAQGCFSFNLCSPRTPSKNHLSSCFLLSAESPEHSSWIHCSVYWFYTFTLGITQIELPHLIAWFPVKPLAPLIYFLSLNFLYFISLQLENRFLGQEVYTIISYSPHSISPSIFSNRHLFKGIRCISTVAKVESLF